MLRRCSIARAKANAINEELAAAGLPAIDPFWVRWSTFVESLGGNL